MGWCMPGAALVHQVSSAATAAAIVTHRDHCGADGEPVVLGEGGEVELELDAPVGASGVGTGVAVCRIMEGHAQTIRSRVAAGRREDLLGIAPGQV